MTTKARRKGGWLIALGVIAGAGAVVLVLKSRKRGSDAATNAELSVTTTGDELLSAVSDSSEPAEPVGKHAATE